MKIFPDYLSLFSWFLSSFGGLNFPGSMALAPEIFPAQESVYNSLFDGTAPSLADALTQTSEERRLWELAGARGISCLTAPLSVVD
jgi:hypothetical protein